MKTYKLPIGLLIFLCANINNVQSATFQHKKAVQLKYVFTAETDSTNKDVLKLYDDLSYEFLFFQKVKSKAKIKREKGTYTLNKNKLSLNKTTEADIKDHPSHFTFIENQGLSKSQRFNNSKKDYELIYVLNNDAKFRLPTYNDPNFGEISNDKKLAKKIIEQKPEYNPVAALPSYTIDVRKRKEENIANEIVPINFISKDSLKLLKAVFVVGPVEESTKEYIAEQKKNAIYLKNLGVQVIEFYHPNAKWKDIVKATEGANIFVYTGHGGVAVFCVTGEIVEGDKIERDLKLHKNAIVIFNHACESAGSSALDNNDIGKKEAFRRVSEYAYPFYKLNVGAYYANNYTDCLIPFLESFFQRKSIKSIYKVQACLYQKIEGCSAYQYDSNFEVSVAAKPSSNKLVTQYVSIGNGKWKKEKVMDYKSYDVAYVGRPNFTVIDLFK